MESSFLQRAKGEPVTRIAAFAHGYVQKLLKQRRLNETNCITFSRVTESSCCCCGGWVPRYDDSLRLKGVKSSLCQVEEQEVTAMLSARET